MYIYIYSAQVINTPHSHISPPQALQATLAPGQRAIRTPHYITRAHTHREMIREWLWEPYRGFSM